MAYRNYDYYRVMLRRMPYEKAYRFVSAHLAAPSFVYERENAEPAWMEKFGFPFMSPEQKRVKEMEAKLAEREQADVPPSPPPAVDPEVSTSRSAFIADYISTHPGATPAAAARAWSKAEKGKGKTEG